VKTCLSCAKSSLVEIAMGANSSSNILTLLQTKHLKEQVFNISVALMEEYCKHWAQNLLTILSLLSINLGKEQLFSKVVTTKVSLSSLQAIHGKEQLFNILHAIEDKVKYSELSMFISPRGIMASPTPMLLPLKSHSFEVGVVEVDSSMWPTCSSSSKHGELSSSVCTMYIFSKVAIASSMGSIAT
jgi:hypothetical protein